MYVCVCNAVTDSDIRNAVIAGARSMRQLSKTTGCGTSCGCCKDMAIETLQQAVSEIRECRQSLPILQMA